MWRERWRGVWMLLPGWDKDFVDGSDYQPRKLSVFLESKGSIK